jgi:hypothetical protein
MNLSFNAGTDDDIGAAISEHFELLLDVISRTRGQRKEALLATVDVIRPIVEQLRVVESDAEIQNYANAYHQVVQTSCLPKLTQTLRAELAEPTADLASIVRAYQRLIQDSAHKQMRGNEGPEHITKHLSRMAASLESIRKSMTLFVGEGNGS